MSEYWDLYCVTCQKEGPLHWNHGEEQVADLITALPAMAELERVMRSLPSQAKWGYGYGLALHGNEWLETTLLEWALEHKGHEIKARSEYGYFYKGCRTRVDCPCGGVHNCSREEGHTGIHIFQVH